MQHRNVLSLVKGFTGSALFSLARCLGPAHADGSTQAFTLLSLLSPSLAAPAAGR